MVKKLEKEGNPGDDYFCSYLAQDTQVLDFFNSKLLVFLIWSKGGAIWHSGAFEEGGGLNLIFYKYDEKEKKHKSYKSSILKGVNILNISKIKKTNILITYETDKKIDEISIVDSNEIERNYYIRKMDINNEEKYFGYNIKSNKIKIDEMKDIHILDYIKDKNKNGNKRIIIGEKKIKDNEENNNYYIYSFDNEKFKMEKIYILEDYNSGCVKQALSFKNGNLFNFR